MTGGTVGNYMLREQSLITCSFAWCACARSPSAVSLSFARRTMSVRSLLLLFLLSLVEVHCQQTLHHYISFMGQTLVNHSYVDLSTVSDGSNSVQCHTDLSTCCSSSQGAHRGDWYFHNGTILPLFGDMYEARGAQRVVIRRTTATGPTGIYRCDIPTNAVHDNTENSVRDTVYVGLYTTEEGSYS